jgi:hypothetical protein
MNSNFLIQINNSMELEENNINLTNSNIYCYWCDKQELEKITLSSNDDYSHISCFLSSKEDKLTKLVNGGYILIFIKTPRILYGIVKVDSIIIKSFPEKNYLEDDDDEYKNDLINNKSIIINHDKYNELIKQYKMVEVPKMFILKFKYLYHFGYEIAIKKFNDSIKNNSIEFKYPCKVQNKEIIKCWNENFLTNFLNYLNHLNYQEKILLVSETETENENETETDLLSSNSLISLSETNKTDETKIKSIDKKKFCIPVLWNGCDIIKNMLIKSKSKPNKKIILEHYVNCIDCEINDNNNKLIELNNKKIVIKNINSSDDIKLFDFIVNKYNNIDNLNISNISSNIEFEKDNINIITCSKSQSVYNQCLFILE